MRVAVGESAGVRRKPHPDSVLEAMRRLGATPAETLYVGDSEVDYATAQAAGIACELVLWGFRDEPELRALRPTSTRARRPIFGTPLRSEAAKRSANKS